MAQTSYIEVAPELADDFYATLQPGDRYTHARVRVKNLIMSAKTKKGISKRSLLPEISVAWAGLSGPEITAWKNAAAVCSMTGWNLFVQDYCARRVNELAGLATPSLLHQCWIGNLRVESPATHAKLSQVHPSFYYVQHKVPGYKAMYEPVKVSEHVSLPFVLSANYSSNLTAVGDGAFAKIYAEFWYSYQARDYYYLLELNLDLVSDWKSITASIYNIVGIVIRYDLHIEIYNAQGDLYFDNIKSEHSGQNWTRDPFNKNISQGFTRNFYQVAKSWDAVIGGPGVDFDSIYKDF